MVKTHTDAVVNTDLPLPNRRQGKVRDVYDLPGASGAGIERLLVIATDRVSAFDVVLPTPVPGKGQILTAISEFWFDFIESQGLCQAHRLAKSLQTIDGLDEHCLEEIEGRSVVVQKCQVVPIECVVRGYLAGSGWVEYQERGTICGEPLPSGLLQGDRLPEPMFTPATKAVQGEHDENISFAQSCQIAGHDVMSTLREQSLEIYSRAHELAKQRGVLLADTKFEFGYPIEPGGGCGETPVLIDEALTPDSSRFWPAESWVPGREQESFDKQYVREYLLGLVATGRWNKLAPGPELPEEIVTNTTARYEEAARRLMHPPVPNAGSFEEGIPSQ